MIYRLCYAAMSAVLFISLVVQSPVAALESSVATEAAPQDSASEQPPEIAPGGSEEVVPNPEIAVATPESSVAESAEQQVSPAPDEIVPPVALSLVDGQLVAEEELVTPPSDSSEIEVPPVDIPDDTMLPPMITEVMVSGTCPDTAVCTGNAVEFVELFNPNGEGVLQLTDMKLRYQSGTSSTEVDLVDLGDISMEPGEIAVFGRNMQTKKPLLQQLADAGGSIRLVKGAQAEVIDQVGWGKTSKHFYAQSAAAPATNKSLQRCLTNGMLINTPVRDTSSEFVVYPNELPTPGVALACPQPLPEPEINQCEGLKLSEIAANTEQQFIEVYNSADAPLDIAECRLQTNRSAVFHSLTSRLLQPGEYHTIYVSETGLSVTKTTVGTVYLLSSDGSVELDSQDYAKLAADTSWALFADDEWRQTYLQTPDAANRYQQYQPCETGYERNEATGRCRKVAVKADVPAECDEGKYRSEETGRCRSLAVEAAVMPCAVGQYRSPETNRCRNLVLASSSSLTPCKVGQERNPETNRCRSIASTVTATLKPCAAGQERNAETNRCRKIVSGDGTAGFKVVETPASSDKLVSWLALGGIGAASLGYMIWEWRRELVSGIGRVLSLLPFVK